MKLLIKTVWEGRRFPVYCLLIIYVPNMFRFNVKSISIQAIFKSNLSVLHVFSSVIKVLEMIMHPYFMVFSDN